QRLEALQMRLVEWLQAPNRHADAVQRDRVVAPHGFQGAMRRTARAHVIFGVNFEEAAQVVLGANRAEMLVLEAGPREPCDRMRGEAKRRQGRRCDNLVHCTAPLPLKISETRIRPASASPSCRSAP